VIAEVGDAMPEVEISVDGEFEEVSGDEALLRQACSIWRATPPRRPGPSRSARG
jgi:hypothetical protein